MSLSFAELIIYLLPGFLGLWVFKNIIQENLDNRTESTQIAIALLFGLAGLLALFAFNFFLDIKYFSVKSLRLSGDVILGDNPYFWSSYLMLCAFSLVAGTICWYLNVKGLTITRLLSRAVTRITKLPEKVPSESSLRVMINDLRFESELLLARVYPLAEGRDKAIIGWLTNYSDTEKQINLTRIEMPCVISGISEELDIQPRQCCINYDSGIVIEIFEWDYEKVQRFERDLRETYCEKVNLP